MKGGKTVQKRRVAAWSHVQSFSMLLSFGPTRPTQPTQPFIIHRASRFVALAPGGIKFVDNAASPSTIRRLLFMISPPRRESFRVGLIAPTQPFNHVVDNLAACPSYLATHFCGTSETEREQREGEKASQVALHYCLPSVMKRCRECRYFSRNTCCAQPCVRSPILNRRMKGS